jgi:MFS family permease
VSIRQEISRTPHGTVPVEPISNSPISCRNAVGLPGCVLPAILADAYMGSINTLILLTFVCGILLYAWAGVTTINSLFAFAIVFGFVNGGVQGIQMGAMTSLTKDLSKIGTRVGMIMSILAFGALCGPPVAGRLIDINKGSFLYAQMFGGTVTVVGSIFLIAARLSETGLVLRERM